MRRRRVVMVGALMLAAGGILAMTVGTSHAYPEPPRQHIVLQKVCPKTLFAPKFNFTNVTDNQSLSNDKTWSPETIDAYLVKGDKTPAVLGGPAGNGFIAKVTVLPGETKLLALGPSDTYAGPYFAFFKVTYKGAVTLMGSKELCSCDDDPV